LGLDKGLGLERMPIMRLIYLSILAGIWAQNAVAATIPDCAGQIEIRGVRVTRVEKNGALILTDGRAVTLEGIRLAQGEAERGPHYLADAAIAALTDMAQAGSVTFTATPPKEDRYDRVRAQGFGKSWFQMALLEQGLARVAIAPDRNECAPDFYEAEARARQRRAGLWALNEYRVRTPQDLKNDIGTFQIVEGWITNVGNGSGRVFLDFSSDWQRGFSAIIAPEDKAAFRDFDLEGLRAKHVRIRGTVQDFKGRPEIALSNPAQIEILN
jgi:endonuclease YncB( thermonuclease family)